MNASSGTIGILKDAFASVFEEEGKSASFNHLLGDAQDSEVNDSSWIEKIMTAPSSKLDAATHQLFVDFLNKTHPTQNEVKYIAKGSAYGKITVTSSVWWLDKIRHGGFWYRSVCPRNSPLTTKDIFSPHRDSYVLIKTPEDSKPIPSSIQELFFYKHGRDPTVKSVQGIFMLFRRYLPLEHSDIQKDYWRTYPIGGGEVYYDQLAPYAEFASADQIVCHFVKTPLDPPDISGFTRQCIHVLPLNWVRCLYILSYPAIQC
jgi:hypothetical protein